MYQEEIVKKIVLWLKILPGS